MSNSHLIRLGNTGLQVSRLCLGTMTFGSSANETESVSILDAATDAGVNFIDTANRYPSDASDERKGTTERIIGKWLKGRRERFILTTKAGGPMGPMPWDAGTSRKHLLSAVDASLERLGTDYVDLFQLHRDDPTTPLDETLEALDTIVRSGRARYVGVSNWGAWRIALALGRSEALRLVKAVTVQPRYNLLFRQFERDLFPMCMAENLATLCYNPLAGGLLTGKYRDKAQPDASTRFGAGSTAAAYKQRYWHDRELQAVNRIMDVALLAGLAPERLAGAWVLAQPGVTCTVLGASRASQLPEVLRAVDTKLDNQVLQELDTITREFRLGDAPPF
ncbi:aryl-alcohol dehydrogenase-like predicted oxidoreductase [Variovorax boronicumulans]|uniref:aldo/keto reductase n=1 Tax=Variovorax boronicumulans TaxID=436515 RepID=UPI002474817D|nr:aldo/keto reductase [Variovorax boronicumulans]MDH6164957.1 aryl-alcohol dehydrogenase-like predicted oxidoreductase [Variovorax boronicumulans]